ncbi:MAG: glycoside hydrolase family 92 protein [Flammeovirgaceae bacterium]|nr:glycoside hydrolase family 92 protein [Flammeovirgaceae bacterium]
MNGLISLFGGKEKYTSFLSSSFERAKYNGDEDQGQMGALGVLMAIGLFQMDGGVSLNSPYEITSPIFDKIEIALNSDYYPGKKFIISTKNNFPENVYIQSAKLNGENWEKCF